MGAGYNSHIIKRRKDEVIKRNKFKKEGLCTQCGEKVKHNLRYCDYCLLRNRISDIEKKTNRIIRLLTYFCPKFKEKN